MSMHSIAPKVIFDEGSIPFILEAFGKEINGEGFIVERGTDSPVLTPDGEEIESSRLGGIKKGSEIFMKDDLYSIIKLTEGEF